MIRGIIIGHGDFAQAMMNTAKQIVGEQDQVDIISNTGQSCSGLVQIIERSLNAEPKSEIIIFLDLPGGSCTISCYNLLRKQPDLNIICGLNLPMLIEFFMLRDKYAAYDLVSILIKKAHDNIFKLGRKNGTEN
ncbi:hypothetical protein A2Y85_05915 [candidate division WOR-3 bacterium RBG_13_43_14]|uniref:PTS EIIA type-4 domain-containing protein n=1 Tax=candidate division WOR-3 bacterium RBG_13_43_14 TaxID=1802590 RepID=A0A1F4U9C0_UNCW3|nr:MAG: hypothetical protein A2Y85_05915 [candidate division WOR-3 bacterium RBG_13_43_14]